MLSNILRLLAKLLIGFTVATAVVSLILMFVVHLPDGGNIRLFEDKRSDFEEVNFALRAELEERGRTKMVFYADADADSVTFNRGDVYTGDAVDGLNRFGVAEIYSITVTENMTVFAYGSSGSEAVVYAPRGNPGSFTERFIEPAARAYKLADGWYYTRMCDLED